MSARLLAIVSVNQSQRIQCQNPGCGHGVYAAIHVVEDEGKLMVLGSTCFAKRYGGMAALGGAVYGAGGGATLSQAQRDQLASNTANFIAQVKAHHEELMAQAQDKLRKSQERMAQMRRVRFEIFRPAAPTVRNPIPSHPWPWQHRQNSSVAVLRAPGGQAWIRVTHSDGSHKLLPWPPFPGWESALPAFCGRADPSVGGYSLPNVVEAIKGLQSVGFSTPQVSRWPEVLSLLTPED